MDLPGHSVHITPLKEIGSDNQYDNYNINLDKFAKVFHNCRPTTYLTEYRIMVENNARITENHDNLTYECMPRHYRASGDEVQYCRDGQWTGSALQCEVEYFMRKDILAGFIMGFVCLLTIPYLAYNFKEKLERMRELRLYRKFCLRFHLSKRHPGFSIRIKKYGFGFVATHRQRWDDDAAIDVLLADLSAPRPSYDTENFLRRYIAAQQVNSAGGNSSDARHTADVEIY